MSRLSVGVACVGSPRKSAQERFVSKKCSGEDIIVVGAYWGAGALVVRRRRDPGKDSEERGCFFFSRYFCV